jgi:hypothetical protein
MASLFDTLEKNAFRAGIQARTDQSRKWFQKSVRDLGTVSPKAVLKDTALTPRSKGISGRMYMYFYDPKHKQTLPYYDRFPMTIMVSPAKGGFQGLNLHYLSPNVRAAFLDSLMDTATSKNLTNTTKLRITAKKLAATKKYKEFKPCWKHYLMAHVKSRLVEVPMPEWEIAVFLPVEQFKKVKKESVWRYSRKQIYQK